MMVLSDINREKLIEIVKLWAEHYPPRDSISSHICRLTVWLLELIANSVPGINYAEKLDSALAIAGIPNEEFEQARVL